MILRLGDKSRRANSIASGFGVSIQAVSRNFFMVQASPYGFFKHRPALTKHALVQGNTNTSLYLTKRFLRNQTHQMKKPNRHSHFWQFGYLVIS
ncbi:hypothetical protein D4R75_03200 [bacterium]|nr:MAG: hypothetical protein D4R75_03200 [bacterium]